MEIVFRRFPNVEGSVADDELMVRPAAKEDRGRLDLAIMVFERGPSSLAQGAGPIERIVAPHDATLDHLLAATFAMRIIQGEQLPSGVEVFARYAAVAREGLRPSSVAEEETLEGVYLAMCNDPGGPLTEPEHARKFLEHWNRLADRIMQAAVRGVDPFEESVVGGPEFARERAFLAHDHEVYRQDVGRGERWMATIPGGPPRASALVLRAPKSLLWKYWARSDRQAPVGEAYLLLGVHWCEGAWVFSTDPVQRLSIKSLADELQLAEAKIDAEAAAADPWFDGDRFGHTLIAAPKAGTRLPEEDVLRIVRRWSRAKRPSGAPLPRSLGAVAAAVAVVGLGIWLTLGAQGNQTHNLDGPSNKPGRRERVRAGYPSRKGTLHVLAIGVSDYEKFDGHGDLEWADADAKGLSGALKALEGQYFQKVATRTLLNKEATEGKVMDVFVELPREVIEGDLVIVALCGHGDVYLRKNFFFLPYDYDPNHKLPATSISWHTLMMSLSELPCPVVVLLDTCHSGAATTARFRGLESEMQSVTDRALDAFQNSQKGVIVMASALGSQVASEHPKWGHGAMTLAVLEGLQGRYLYEPAGGTATTRLPQTEDTDGVISFAELREYTRKRVKELTGGSQAVVSGRSADIDPDAVPLIRLEP